MPLVCLVVPLVPMAVISIVVAMIRISGHKGKAYQAMAHIWVGLLIGLAIRGDHAAFLQVVILSVVEVACFLAFKIQDL